MSDTENSEHSRRNLTTRSKLTVRTTVRLLIDDLIEELDLDAARNRFDNHSPGRTATR